MCDAMVGSDHRPVACRLELEVNPGVIGFNTLSPEEVAAAAAAAQAAGTHVDCDCITGVVVMRYCCCCCCCSCR